MMDDLFDDLWSVQSPTPDDRVSTRLLTDPQQLAALDKIEKVFECIVDSLANNDKQLTILLKRKDNNTLLRRIVTAEAHKMLGDSVRKIELDVLESNRLMDIYYKDPALFLKQSVVDRYIEDISFTFGVPRSALCVAAAAKGLFAGALSISKDTGEVLDGRLSQEGQLIPDIGVEDEVDVHGARWVLIIEKEAVFHSLVSSDRWSSMSQEGIMITGKGYPDLASKLLCSKIASKKCTDTNEPPPIHALVDWDPDGLGIMSSYKHGSASLQQYDNPTLSRLNWLGLKSSELCLTDDHRQNQQLLPLSSRDRRKATKMLEWRNLDENGRESGWRREVQIMLMLNFKAEIQLMDGREGGLMNWLKDTLCLKEE